MNKLFALEKRRLKGLLVKTFRTLKGFSNVDYRKPFVLNENPTRNKGLKLFPNPFNSRVCMKT